MASGRFMCDRLRLIFGRSRIFLIAGLLSFTGLTLVVSSPAISNLLKIQVLDIIIATVGFAITGLGLSTLIPTCFSTAGNIPNVHAGTAISFVAFFTYSGSIVSPYIIGLISDLFNDLRVAFFFDSILLLLISPLSFLIPKETFQLQESVTTPILKQNLFTIEEE